jgi:hypothetical protein
VACDLLSNTFKVLGYGDILAKGETSAQNLNLLPESIEELAPHDDHIQIP